jgi:hypothetical protein
VIGYGDRVGTFPERSFLGGSGFRGGNRICLVWHGVVPRREETRQESFIAGLSYERNKGEAASKSFLKKSGRGLPELLFHTWIQEDNHMR